jgi:hypothetical protein
LCVESILLFRAAHARPFPQDELLAGKMADSSRWGLLLGKTFWFFFGGGGCGGGIDSLCLKHTLYVCYKKKIYIDRVELYMWKGKERLDGYQSADLPSRTKLPQ